MGTSVDAHTNDQLETALANADLRVLAMCLVHLTGDRKWMQPPFLPRRDVRLVADLTAGFPDEVAAELRSAVAAAFRDNAAPTPVLHDPGRELLAEMLSVCLGEQVPPEYVPMVREDMGFDSGAVTWSTPGAPAQDRLRADVDTTVLVVGAGISGMALSVRLAGLGIDHQIIEKNADVGGTWFENRYPGCGVDTPNQFYSYSYAAHHGWGYHFSPRGELQAYLERFSDQQGIRERTTFNVEMIAGDWDDDTATWKVSLRDGNTGRERTLTCRVLVPAIGHFNRPNDITIRGVENFRGSVFHSARWPDNVDLTGKHVALVGTGATSVQIAPTIADSVASLTVYQRSPQWVRPVDGINDPVPEGTEWLLRNVPYYAIWNRFTLFWRYGDGLLQYLRKDPEWPHPERALNRVNDRHREEMTRHLTAELADRPDLIEKCLPTYPPYGKRILLDKGWYKTLVRDHVELVTDAIDHLDTGAVVTADGTRRPADVVIMALGFKVSDLAARLNITGRDGTQLAQEWANDDPRAYLGITAPKFPNLFCMYGPNTNTGHGGSAFLLAESQSRYIAGAVRDLVENDLLSIECRQGVLDEYVDRMHTEHAELIWTHPGMSTYYRNPHGRVVSVMPWRLVDYWRMTHEPNLEDFIVRS